MQGSTFRERVLQLLHTQGMSRREAYRTFRAIFDVMRAAVLRGEIVEVPGIGTLQARHYTVRKAFKVLYNVDTGRRQLMMSRPKSRRIRFRPIQERNP